jgi:hypothetical protein
MSMNVSPDTAPRPQRMADAERAAAARRLTFTARAALAVALALAAATSAPGQSPSSSPTQRRAAFDAWMDTQAYASLAARQEHLAGLGSSLEVATRGREVRTALLEMIGGLPETTAPLNARITRTQQRDGYRIEHLIYESLPGLRVTALVYVPDGSVPFPAVLGTAGHAADGKAAAIYQHAWISFARRGFLVLAYDPPGQGERYEYFDPATNDSRVGMGVREHIMTGQQLMLTGGHIAQYMVQDGRRALDYLETRGDVDLRHVAVAGNSGGGTQAALLGVFEPRLSASVVSCYMTSWQQLWRGPGPQDAEQVIPGFLSRGFDFGDFALATAPRGFLISSAIRDYFPITGARQTFAELRPLYARFGHPGKLAMVENDATHGWSQPLREGAYRWLGTWFGQSQDATEAPLTVDEPETLRATSTGQLATSEEGSLTIREVHAAEARALAARRTPVRQHAIAALLALEDDPPAPRVVSRDGQADARRVSLVIEVEPGIRLRAELRRPASATGPAVLLVDDRGIDASAHVDALVARGHTVLALDVRGTGELGPETGTAGYAPAYQLAARAWLLGTSMVGWQTRDVLAGLAVLRAEAPEATSREIHARGQTVAAALFAAQFDRPDAVVLEEGLVSYLDLATVDEYEDASLFIVPGVLRVTDLPELMAAMAPSHVTLRNPKAPTGETIAQDSLARHMGVPVPGNVVVER